MQGQWTGAKQDVAKLLSGKPSITSKLYPLFGAFEIDCVLREIGALGLARNTSKRRYDRAKLLHNSGYHDRSGLESQLVHYRKVCAKRRENVQEKEGEIEALRGKMLLGDIGNISSRKAGSKRSIGLMNEWISLYHATSFTPCDRCVYITPSCQCQIAIAESDIARMGANLFVALSTVAHLI